MATVFGFAAIRSRLDGWRGSQKSTPPPLTRAESPIRSLKLVEKSDDDYSLSLLLENVVIPKLIADRDKPGARTGIVNWPQPLRSTRQTNIADKDVEEFTRLSLNDDARAMLDFVDGFRAGGISVEALFVELLAPAARKLGTYWEDDTEDFVGVTMGLWRIQEVLRELADRHPPQAISGSNHRSALFSAMPGEQHSFGTLMVSECFQRAGWETDVQIEPTAPDLIEKLSENSYDLVGLTLSCACSREALQSLVRSIKAQSRNPDVCIMLGGRFINEQPELVKSSGANATASDAPSAVALANFLVPVKLACVETSA